MSTDHLTADGLLDRVRAVVPLIAERAADAEDQRKPDDDVIAALAATGTFKALVPERFGGYELDLDTFFDIGVAVAEACPSTGWITTFYMEHNWLLGMFTDEAKAEAFGTEGYVLAPGTVNPSGEAVRHDDHFEVSGSWQFGTGVVHADWVLLSARLVSDEPVLPRMFLVPVGDVEVKDTWHVDGMSATGSRDIIARSVSVPLHRMGGFPSPTWDLPLDAPYLDRIPMRPFLSLTAAIPAVGCAKRAVELFRAKLPQRTLFGSSKKQSEFAPAQVRLGTLAARTAMAEQSMRALATRMTAHSRGELQLSMLEHSEMRLAIALLVRDCRDVVRDVMEASGAGVHHLSNELQRVHRDAHMIAAHTVFDVDLAALEHGRFLLAEQR